MLWTKIIRLDQLILKPTFANSYFTFQSIDGELKKLKYAFMENTECLKFDRTKNLHVFCPLK